MSWDRWLTLLYPPSCAHCRAPLLSVKPLLCPTCLDNFLPAGETSCRKKSIMEGVSSTSIFSLGSPGASLTKRLMREKDYRLAKLLALYLCEQKEKLLWPDPDAIIPMPKMPGAPLLAAILRRHFSVRRQIRSGNLYIISPSDPERKALVRTVEKAARAIPKRLFFLSLLKREERGLISGRG